MEKSLTDLLSELGPFISQNKLFLGALRHIGFNVWIHFYHFIDESISLIDVAMFDTAEEDLQDNIVNPVNLLRVLHIDISDAGPHGRKTAVIRFEESGNIRECKIYFVALAFHVAVKPVHKSA